MDAGERVCEGMVVALIAAVVIGSVSLGIHGRRHAVEGAVQLPRISNPHAESLPDLITHSRLRSQLAHELR